MHKAILNLQYHSCDDLTGGSLVLWREPTEISLGGALRQASSRFRFVFSGDFNPSFSWSSSWWWRPWFCWQPFGQETHCSISNLLHLLKSLFYAQFWIPEFDLVKILCYFRRMLVLYSFGPLEWEGWWCLWKELSKRSFWALKKSDPRRICHHGTGIDQRVNLFGCNFLNSNFLCVLLKI